MNLVLELMKKYKSLIAYGFFGVLTTVINIVVYYLCYDVGGISNVISNVIAWVVAVLTAFITNKLWVFESKSFEPKILFYELWTFVGCRLVTGVMDLMIMYICVDVLGWPAMFMKIASNVLVIILNYIFSKLIIFKKR